MAVNVNTNVAAMTAQRYLNSANSAQQTSMERLSSGFKINSAKDDAAGLQISNRLSLSTVLYSIPSFFFVFFHFLSLPPARPSLFSFLPSFM